MTAQQIAALPTADKNAAYRAAAPPEMFGDPDGDGDGHRQARCPRCRAFVSWHPVAEGRRESHYGEIVAYADYECRRCGDGWGDEWTVGRVFGPLPPWSDPYAVLHEGEWTTYLALESAEMAREMDAWREQDRARMDPEEFAAMYGGAHLHGLAER